MSYKACGGLVAFENSLPNLSTLSMDVGDITPHWTERTENNGIVNRQLAWITVPVGNGKTRKLEVTPRFTRSLAARFHVGETMFKYFLPDEVFARLQQVHPRKRVRLTVDKGRALAMSNPTKGIVHPEDLVRLLREQRSRVTDVKYHLGVVISTHEMNDAPWLVGGTKSFDHLDGRDFDIAIAIDDGTLNLGKLADACVGLAALDISFECDTEVLEIMKRHAAGYYNPKRPGAQEFKQTFTMETPIDGLGLPSVYLSLIRQICKNGLVGYAPSFRTTISIGKDDGDNPILPLSRAMECFSNDEGFDTLRQRLEAALNSEASVYETRMLAKAIHTDFAGRREDTLRSADVFTALTELTGDVAVKFAVATEDAINRKTQSRLAMNCTVYDLLNFATEVTSHFGDLLTDGATRTIAWVGQTLADAGGFDLENSLETTTEDWAEIENEVERLRQERRWILKQREAPALHLNGVLRNTQMVHAVSGSPVPAATPESAAVWLTGDWDPEDADLDTDDG